jgi:hypothetical protein
MNTEINYIRKAVTNAFGNCEYGPVEGTGECGNKRKIFGSINGMEFIDYMTDYWFLDDCAPCSQFFFS